ncbi:MAG: hypothetical protein M3139_18360, partial [Bacteroidota bacterium]|nr:hypothetical protein [Bacteroidota bacterium]
MSRRKYSKVLTGVQWAAKKTSRKKEDKRENYNLVTYELLEKSGETVVTITQDNVQSEKEKEH